MSASGWSNATQTLSALSSPALVAMSAPCTGWSNRQRHCSAAGAGPRQPCTSVP